MTAREYHEATKHTVERLRAQAYGLDWGNMPNPFRHYEGVPVVDLPADIPAPGIPALDVLNGVAGTPEASDGAIFLSQLFFYSASISATKVVPSSGYRYALRVNPSSGNLHPTEFHFATRGLRGWEDGLYHYRASSHMAELRARGDFNTLLDCSGAPLVIVLTSIAWREAWKYRQRAYRYCLHDIGHAWQAVELAARALGCEARVRTIFNDAQVMDTLRPAEDEWPMLLMSITGDGLPLEPPRSEWLGGEPNALSDETVPYPLIDAVHAATCRPKPASGSAGGDSFAVVVRRRRSALDFEGGERTIARTQLHTLLACAAQPFSWDLDGRFVHLYAYVNRVDGVEPGLYRWRPGVEGLESLKGGDQRLIAAGLSLQQSLAGNSCVTFSMIAALDQLWERYGDRGYRFAHFEAGAIGHRFYLAAEAMGFQSTGIGAFFDDQVHRYLDIEPSEGQVVYHFASGYAVPDLRLSA
ncbi:MAG: SagB/ThcOx family dehydrogenase [Bryobacteraceae bacterium]|nr:SagB/ThcOx family dehydrogenase [Bryobacteraceae bacterium]